MREADISYAQQTFDYALSQKNTGTESVWFDMAAVIQIPKLSTGKAFYLRKYKTYMEGFHMGSTKQNHLYCWGQKDGNKGSIEVVSALYMLINQHVEPTTKHLVLWMDNTSSQNKNSNMLLFMLLLTDPKSPLFRFDRVSLKFAPVGHTYSHCDRSFAHIGQHMKKRKVIADPKELLEIGNETKNCNSHWLEREQRIYNWYAYLEQFFAIDNKLLYHDERPTLMKTRQFSFGFTDIEDEKTGSTVLI